jgi:hypothetical protein
MPDEGMGRDSHDPILTRFTSLTLDGAGTFPAICCKGAIPVKLLRFDAGNHGFKRVWNGAEAGSDLGVASIADHQSTRILREAFSIRLRV